MGETMPIGGVACVTFHMSPVMCHLSCFTCQVSSVKFNFFLAFFYAIKFFLSCNPTTKIAQSGGASQGLPLLVS